MTGRSGGILVFAESSETCLELLGKAREVADGLDTQVDVALFGENADAWADELGGWGADRLYTAEDPRLVGFSVEPYTDALVELMEQTKPSVALFAATKRGAEMAPRVAARLGSGCVSSCLDVYVDPETQSVEAQAMVYSGRGISTYLVKKKPAVLLVAPNTFARRACEARSLETIAFQPTINDQRVQTLEVKPRAAAGSRLEDARVVVDVGQGVRQEDGLAMAQELADLLGGQLACTRPVSSERGWFPEWLGLSGKRISPRLCITLGVSGAIQHIIGIRGSEFIVAVDNNENSAMLTQSDFGVLADLHGFVPALIEALRARGLRLA